MRNYLPWDAPNVYVLETEWDVNQANEVRPCGNFLGSKWKLGDVVEFPSEWVNQHAY